MNILQALDSPELMEVLAAIEHDRWSGQAKTALYELTDERRERWGKLANVPYRDLSEEMKELDRMRVREYMGAVRSFLGKVGA